MEEKKEHKKENFDINKKNNKQNKQLGIVMIILGIFFLIILLMFLFFGEKSKFEYRGVKFEKIKQGNLTLYKTEIPLVNKSGEISKFNIFMTNNPLKLNVPFDGNMTYSPKKLFVLNSEERFQCDGDGAVSVGNLQLLYSVLGTEVVKDPNVTCDSKGRYLYAVLKSGNKTKIVQTGNFCYEIIINNCEILKATERFMLETLVKLNEKFEKD